MIKSIYILESTAWKGYVELQYDELMLLRNMDMSNAELSEDQHIWFLKNLPRELAELQQLMAKSKSATLTEVKKEVSFDEFWNRYDEKIRSSKKKSEKIWNRLSKSDQLKAYEFIRKYEKAIPQGVSKKYCETYLNAELWNN